MQVKVDFDSLSYKRAGDFFKLMPSDDNQNATINQIN